MGRELKRKQAKREGKNVKEVQKQNKEKPMEPKTFITIIILLLLLFVILYLLTGIFITKDIKWFEKKDNEVSDNKTITNKILASDTLRQTEEEYYVYYYDSNKEDSSISALVSGLGGKVYRVDLGDDFNSNFVGTPSGIVENISDLKVTDPTVIKVVSEKITQFYSGKTEIEVALK